VKTIQPGLLEEAVERLKSEFQPEEIYLFGSHAWGVPSEDSDVDLMVIVPSSDERPIRRDQRAQKCLGRLAVPADVLVRTRGEVDRYKHLRASLFHQVLRQGRKLYGGGRLGTGQGLARGCVCLIDIDSPFNSIKSVE
jgi:predicted nucleotidyltransferase